jgi:hypothetical protein
LPTKRLRDDAPFSLEDGIGGSLKCIWCGG